MTLGLRLVGFGFGYESCSAQLEDNPHRISRLMFVDGICDIPAPEAFVYCHIIQ